MNTCLLLVDLQNDYFSGGRMELVGTRQAAEKAGLLLNHCRKTQIPAIHVQHIAIQPGATFFLPETEGANINDAVAPSGSEPVIVKNYPNSFRGTSLMEILKKQAVEHLVICGAMSHMCIDATTRAAFDAGFKCTVVEDACATRNLLFNGRTIKAADVHGAFMAALSAVYATVTSTREIMDGMK